MYNLRPVSEKAAADWCPASTDGLVVAQAVQVVIEREFCTYNSI